MHIFDSDQMACAHRSLTPSLWVTTWYDHDFWKITDLPVKVFTTLETTIHSLVFPPLYFQLLQSYKEDHLIVPATKICDLQNAWAKYVKEIGNWGLH